MSRAETKRVGHVITTYHQSEFTVAGGIVVPRLGLISRGDTQTQPQVQREHVADLASDLPISYLRVRNNNVKRKSVCQKQTTVT